MGERGRKVEKGFVRADEARNVKEKLLRHAEKDAANIEAKLSEAFALSVMEENDNYVPQIGDIFYIQDDTTTGTFRLEGIVRGRIPKYKFVHIEHSWIRTTYTPFAFYEKFLGAESKIEQNKFPKSYIILKDK